MKRDMIRNNARLYTGVEVTKKNLDYINNMIRPGMIIKTPDNNSNELLYNYYKNDTDCINNIVGYTGIKTHSKIYVCINRPSTDDMYVLFEDDGCDVMGLSESLFAQADDVITAYDVITSSRDYVKNKLIVKIMDRIYSDNQYSLSVNLTSAEKINNTNPVITIASGDDGTALTFMKGSYVVFTYGRQNYRSAFCGIKSFTNDDLKLYNDLP